MCFEDSAGLSAFLRAWFSPLVRKGEWGFSNEGECDLSLITFVNILVYPFPVANLGRRESMDVHP